jgi:hypothetical protein
MSWTNKGYSCSVIFSLLANSRARSKGILHHISTMKGTSEKLNSPHTLEVHWANLDDVARLLTLQDTVSSTSRHSRNIQELGSIDHVIIWKGSVLLPIREERSVLTFAASHAHAFRLDLETETTLVFPKRGGYTRFHPGRSNLASVVKRLGLIALGAR